MNKMRFPTKENIEKIRKLLLKYAPMLFTGKINLWKRLQTQNENVQEHSTRLGGVFSLKEMPYLIFKKDMITTVRGKKRLQDPASRISVSVRSANIAKAKKVIENNKFKHLKIPRSVEFEIIPTDSKLRKYKVLAQEKLCAVMEGDKPKKIRTVDFPEQAIEELVLFILETGYYDVDDRNLLVIKEEGQYQIGIIDFEYVDLDKLEVAFYGSRTIAGLVKVLPEKKDLIENILRRKNQGSLIKG